MARVAVHGCDLQRLDALFYGKDPEKARVGSPDRFYERVYSERALGALDDPDAAAEALKSLLFGPRPEGVLGPVHESVFRSIVLTLCPRIDDDAFGGASLAEARHAAQELTGPLGPELSESLERRRLEHARFDENPSHPLYSYWTRDEMKRFLQRCEAAGSDSPLASSERTRRLRDVWRGALAQGPDAVLVITR